MLDYEISPSEAARLLREKTVSEKTVRLIDVREPWEFATAKIEGSVPIPMNEVPLRAQGELDAGQRLIIVCHHGVRSMNVTIWLRNHGFQQVRSMRGGIDAWSVEVDPKVSRY